MAPVAASVAGEWICAPQQRRRVRELDRATAPRFGATVVRKALPRDVAPVLEVAEALIGGTQATRDIIRRVLARRPDSLWTFLRNERVVGGFAMLMLNPVGLEALLAATMDTRDPPMELLAGPAELPAAIYLWGTAHLGATDGMVQMAVRLQSPPYEKANLYAVPYTLAGLRSHQRWGFRPVSGHPRHLSEYVRLANRLH
jgi:hypothetical protein